MINWINTYSVVINMSITLCLVFITAYYAWLTRRILSTTETNSKLSLNPVIGFKIKDIVIGKVFGPDRRQMGVSLEIENVGNSPAIEIFVDCEIELRYSDIKGKNVIPMRFEPDLVPYLRQDGTTTELNCSFGNTLIKHFLEDVAESERLNIDRIINNPSRESFKASKLRVYAYYKNSLGQEFKSYYQTEITIWKMNFENPIPNEDEKANVNMLHIPRPSFHASPIKQEDREKDMQDRDSKRNLCGW